MFLDFRVLGSRLLLGIEYCAPGFAAALLELGVMILSEGCFLGLVGVFKSACFFVRWVFCGLLRRRLLLVIWVNGRLL